MNQRPYVSIRANLAVDSFRRSLPVLMDPSVRPIRADPDLVAGLLVALAGDTTNALAIARMILERPALLTLTSSDYEVIGGWPAVFEALERLK